MRIFDDAVRNSKPIEPDPEPTPQADEWPDLTLPGTNDATSPFPVDCLPHVLFQAATEAARFIKTDVASTAIIGLMAVAITIGKRAMIEERRNLLHFAALFSVIVQKSGERKSPAFAVMMAAIERWAESKMEGYNLEVAKIKAANAVAETRLLNLKLKAKKDLTEQERTNLIIEMAHEELKIIPIPAGPRKTTSDCTEEKLFQKMYRKNGEFAVASGEGRQIVDTILGRYSGGNRTGDAIYLAGVSGDSITRDRVGNEKTGSEDLAIAHPCLNVCIMIQPDKFQELLQHPPLRDSGLIARILSCEPVSLIGSRFEEVDEPDLDESAMAGFYGVITKFLDTKRS